MIGFRRPVFTQNQAISHEFIHQSIWISNDNHRRAANLNEILEIVEMTLPHTCFNSMRIFIQAQSFPRMNDIRYVLYLHEGILNKIAKLSSRKESNGEDNRIFWSFILQGQGYSAVNSHMDARTSVRSPCNDSFMTEIRSIGYRVLINMK